MPIHNLNIRGQKLPKIGNIRKGERIPVMTKGKNPIPKKDARGNIVYRPKETPHFVFHYDPNDTQSPQIITKEFGEKPTWFNAALAYGEIDQAWDCWYEAYTFNQMVARSDGTVVTYLRDVTNDQKLILNGQIVEPPKDPESPAGQLIAGLSTGDLLSYQDDMVVAVSGSGGNITFDAVGRLEIIIPELERYATFTLHTGGRWVDIPHITEMVARIHDIAEQTGFPANAIPLIISRVLGQLSYIGDDGKKHKRETWNIQIEIAPRIFKGLLSAYENTPIRLLAGAPPTEHDYPEGDKVQRQIEPLYLADGGPEPIEESSTFDSPEAYDEMKTEDIKPSTKKQPSNKYSQATVSVLSEKPVKEVVRLGYFENETAAAKVLAHFEPKELPIGVIVERAEVYRDWKKLLLGEDLKDTEATAEAIKRTNAGKQVGMDG